MKSSDRAVLVGLLIVGLGAAFWFMFLAPKRQEASDLEAKIAEVQSQIQASEATVAAAEAARADYDSNYRTVVTLGKAVPSDADTPSLLTQFQTLADRTGVSFRSLELTQNGNAPTPTPAVETTTDQNAEAASGDTATPAATPTAPVATESTAASLPLGASVGPAGLPVMPYALVFDGDFFEMADFLEALDGLVSEGDRAIEVGGRLMTINGFTMARPTGDANGPLQMQLTLTTYVTPEDQGVTAGATPVAPAVGEPTPVAAPAGTVAP